MKEKIEGKRKTNKIKIVFIVILVVAILIVIIILIVHLIKNKNSVYSGIYMPYEEGVTEHEDIHQNEFKKEKKNHAKMKKSKGKRFK